MPVAGEFTKRIIKGHRIVLDLYNRQASLLAQHVGYARVAANWAISAFKAAIECDEWYSRRPRESSSTQSGRWSSLGRRPFHGTHPRTPSST